MESHPIFLVTLGIMVGVAGYELIRQWWESRLG